MTYPLRALGALCDIVIGRTPSRSEPSYWGKGNKWVSISDLNGKIVSHTKEEITDHAVASVRCRRVAKGTLLFSFKLSIGKMAFAGSDLFTNEAIAALEIKDKKLLSADYLYYALQSAKINGSNQAAKGKTLNSKSLAEIEVPLPSLDDQVRIAQLLGSVGRLIAQRKQHLQELDRLLKSVFIEMFGDPVRNERGWEKKALDNLGSLNRGVSKHRPRNAPELLGGTYPLIQTGEVSNADTYILSYAHTYSDLGFAQSKLWPSGTLCITIAANIAKTGILTFDACFPDSVVGFIPHEDESNALYVHGLFWFFQAILEKNAPAAAQKNINLEILRGLEVPKPPVDLQNQFAAIVARVENLRLHYLRSLTDLQALYGSLRQQAFKGELDLSQVPLPEPEAMQSGVSTMSPTLPTDGLPSLPELPAGFSLSHTAKRKQALRFWFDAYLGALRTGEGFPLRKLVDAINFRLIVMDDEDREFDAVDHDTLKAWVFEALESGRLRQSYDEQRNDLYLHRPPAASSMA